MQRRVVLGSKILAGEITVLSRATEGSFSRQVKASGAVGRHKGVATPLVNVTSHQTSETTFRVATDYTEWNGLKLLMLLFDPQSLNFKLIAKE